MPLWLRAHDSILAFLPLTFNGGVTNVWAGAGESDEVLFPIGVVGHVVADISDGLQSKGPQHGDQRRE